MKNAPVTSLPASLVLAETATPRYTSYPTAPHFHAGIDGAALARWLGELPEGARLSLYLHVPYCRSICNYCGCNAKSVLREEPLDAYAASLAREIEIVAAATRARAVSDVHWGGGTPSLLGPGRLKSIWQALAWRFDLSGLKEHAIELDPRTVTAELAEGLADIGVTRASLGVQDINPHVQKAMGREQPPEIVERAVALLRAVGIGALNFDLMYGLPEQSVEDVRRTARFAASLDPARIAMFGYAHVPWFKVHQRLIDAAALPGSGERLAQAQAARDTLAAAGFEAIGLDHFARADDPLAVAAREGRLRRNFQGYVADEADALLGFGPSAIGRAPQGFAQNAVDVAGWRRLVEAGSLAAARGVAISPEDRLRSQAIERLMCDFELDYGALAARVAGDPAALDDAAGRLDELAAMGVLAHEGRRVRVTMAGRPFARLAAAAFDAYLSQGAARHSASV